MALVGIAGPQQQRLGMTWSRRFILSFRTKWGIAIDTHAAWASVGIPRRKGSGSEW